MSISCSHFALLHQRVEDLSRKFVDDQIVDEQQNPLTFIPDLDRLAAYRLLVHAELEHFLEAKARDRVAGAIAKFASGSDWVCDQPSILVLAIAVRMPLPNIDITDASRFIVFMHDLFSEINKAIARNNGIRANSFAFLSICAGKTIEEVDVVLSNGLNSYGTDRGEVAHRSVTHCSSIQAPSVECANARTLVDQLAVYFEVHP